MFNFIIKRRIKRDLRNIERANRFLGLDEINSVMVFFLPDQYEAADVFIKKLRGMGKEVSGWTYLPKKYKKELPEMEYRIFEEKEDFDWLGEPWSDTIDELLAAPCDAMIDLTSTDCYPLIYLFIQRESMFKIGISKNFEPNLYDLTITRTKKKDTAFFADQVIFYLKRIRS